MIFEYSPEKNAYLKSTRNISFEEIIEVLDTIWPIHDEIHTDDDRYPNQRIFYVHVRDYIYRVPYVPNGEKAFLKTIYPSRLATKRFLTQ